MKTGRQRVERDQIRSSRWQPRKGGHEGEKFDGLVESIRAHGIINPLLAFVNEEGQVELITGHRRLAAAAVAKVAQIPVDIVGNLPEMAEKDAKILLDRYHEMVLADNLHHEDLSSLEEARGLSRLIEETELTQEEVGKRLGKSQQWVSDRLALLKCAPEVQKGLTERAVEETVARKLAQLPQAYQGPVMEYVKGKPSREAIQIIGEIGEATEPGFWDLPDDKPCDAEHYNIELMMEDCLDQVPKEKVPEVLIKLHQGNDLRGPARRISHFMGGFAKSCGLERQTLDEWLAEHSRTCEECIFEGEGLWPGCESDDVQTCRYFFDGEDPVRLPVPCGETEKDCQECQEDPGWCTDAGCYVLHLQAVKEEAEEAVDESELGREMEARATLRRFYDRQLKEDVDTEHWLAQGCRYCASFRGPQQRDQCGYEKPQYVRTAFWQNDGVIVPWCSECRLRDLSRIPEIEQSRFNEIVLGWLEAWASNVAWLPGDDEEEIIQAIREAGLNKKQLVALMTCAINPSPNDYRPELRLMDMITGEEQTWTRVEETEEEPEDRVEEAEAEGEPGQAIEEAEPEEAEEVPEEEPELEEIPAGM